MRLAQLTLVSKNRRVLNPKLSRGSLGRAEVHFTDIWFFGSNWVLMETANRYEGLCISNIADPIQVDFQV